MQQDYFTVIRFRYIASAAVLIKKLSSNRNGLADDNLLSMNQVHELIGLKSNTGVILICMASVLSMLYQ